MATMTKRERVLRTARFEETDRVPLYDIFQNDGVIEHYAGRKLDYETGAESVARAVGNSLDMTRMISSPQKPETVKHANGLVIQVERWTSWIVERPFHDFNTAREWVKNTIREREATVFDESHRAGFRKHVETLNAQFIAGDSRGINDPTVFVQESGAGLTDIYWLLGMDLFTEFLMDAPDLIEEWLEANNQMELRRVAAIADPDLVPIALTYDDVAHKTGTLFSPAWLRKLWIPRLKRLVDAWHARDTICLFHSDGNLWGILDDLVGAGIDGLNPIEVMAGMTVKKVREKYPNLFMAGGIDVSQLLPLGKPEEVREACCEAIQDTQGRGFFMGSTTELHWEVPLENARAMYDYYHQ